MINPTNADTVNEDTLGLRGADAAMLRTAADVRRIAAQTGTPIATWRDGRVVLVTVPPLSPVSTEAPATTGQPRS